MKTVDIALAINLSLFVTAPASALLYLHFWFRDKNIGLLEPIEVVICCLLIIFGIFCFVYFVCKGFKHSRKPIGLQGASRYVSNLIRDLEGKGDKS